ncbi:hypothetical protein E2C00_27825 [Streptomyces sp. WAC05374]|uniref:DUF6113 family protein n=1 Tax=Streptomyces sp. WAC05374 TaxID=2487420 RepID=UPI000F88B007|nr:DUF6113 family protein [Streptomyces sp. WAC05374]RST14705.1 hypothetical protein EF905_16945 [Streptomyces sp. WAC05374]TDF43323.1 hypothetical protein E2B92_20680 [Streptomyces sp. WAC05374]TDF51109.1 hypothetical protein E2C00_27825 [Streptomyces sp. WAC05374]TDF52148.1 hypothetical protein E2C02_21340 [Streptomyces sp. WAC05374]
MRAGRAAAYAGLAVLGAVVGLAGTLVQGAWFPGGLLLALAACVGLFYGGLRTTGTQLGVVAPGVGWLVAVVVASMGRPEGDQVFWGGVAELVYVLGGMAAAVMCATLPRLPHRDGTTGSLGM